MKTEIIKKGEVIFTVDENTTEEMMEVKFKELVDTETIEKLELVFEKGTTIEDVNDLFRNNTDEKVVFQRLYLND